MTDLLTAPGVPIPPDDLAVHRAREVARLVASGASPFTRLVECRRRSDPLKGDVLVLDVEVELPQHPVNAIHLHERIAVTFLDDDRTFPEVEALRADFPQVPHQNVRQSEIPKSLCLYEEPWSAIRLQWSPGAYIGRIRDWLALTARGQLHAPDQALEPFFLSAHGTFVLSGSVIEDATSAIPTGIWVEARGADRGRPVLVAIAATDTAPTPDAPFVATAIRLGPRTAGVIRRTPSNLAELHDLLAEAGDDLVGQLRARFKHWTTRPDLLDKQLVIVLLLPMTRSAGGRPEEGDAAYAFLAPASVADVGMAIDLWERAAGSLGLNMAPNPDRHGESIELRMMNVVRELSRESASRLNGLGNPSTISVVAVGVGALGSQVVLNLERAGWGHWTYVDGDSLLPHNLARHALVGALVGWPKAEALAATVGTTVDGGYCPTSIVADVLDPGSASEPLLEALGATDVIVDMSASVPVARAIIRDFDTTARRISLFLNPSGTDLVVLAEDADRESMLDSLEMQYYRALLDDPDLSGHLARPETGIRYGQACRDVSFEVAQDLVALHASLGARVLRQVTDRPDARITIFRADVDDLTVSRVDVAVSSTVEHDFGEWRLVTDTTLLDRVAASREERLPRETGGVLLGAVDALRKVVYVVATLPSPPDSEEWPTSYIRGTHGLAEQVERVGEVTAAQIEYVGEWHSHPDGSSVLASGDDRKALSYLADLRAADGRPAVFLIMGNGDHHWYLSETV